MEEAPKDKDWSPLVDVGLCADKNRKHRRWMEDFHSLVPSFAGLKGVLLAVYDGHGGVGASKFASENFPRILETVLQEKGGAEAVLRDAGGSPAREAIQEAIRRCDDEMKPSVPHAGACIGLCVIVEIGGKRLLFAANLGDTRIVLARNGKAERLSVDHKPKDEGETARIEAAGGFIDADGRVNSILAVSRALGDHLMKGEGRNFVINEIAFRAVEITEADVLVIVACDGLWDVVDDQAAVDIALEDPPADDATPSPSPAAVEAASATAKRLLVRALKDGSTDNISVIVGRL